MNQGKLEVVTQEMVEAEAPILGPPDTKSLLIGKDSDVGKN